MYKLIQKNAEQSLIFNKTYKRQIQAKACYHNIWRICTHNNFKENYKIAYGYAHAMGNLYVAHCFFIDEEGRAVDPTLPSPEKDEYYVLREFDRKEYFEIITKYRNPSLFEYEELEQIKQEFIFWGIENGVVAVG